MAPGSYKRLSNCKKSCLPPKKTCNVTFVVARMTLLGYSLPAEFSLLQGAQDDDLQFDEDPQLGFGCRIGCCFGLYVCQPTLGSAYAAGEAKRDCVCQPAVDSADAAGQAKRDCVCQPTVDSADAAGHSKRDCVCQSALDS